MMESDQRHDGEVGIETSDLEQDSSEQNKGVENVVLPTTSSDTDLKYDEPKGIFDSVEFSDVNIKVGTRSIKAHKAVLAQRSRRFEEIFKDDPGVQLTELTLEDVDPNAALGMVAFLYGLIYDGKSRLCRPESAFGGGTVFMKRAGIKYFVDLYGAADRYQVEALKIEIANGLEATLNLQKVDVPIDGARYIYGRETAKDLREAAIKAIAKRLKDGTSYWKFDELLVEVPELARELLLDVTKTYRQPRFESESSGRPI